MKRLPIYFFADLVATALIGIVWLFKGACLKSEWLKANKTVGTGA